MFTGRESVNYLWCSWLSSPVEKVLTIYLRSDYGTIRLIISFVFNNKSFIYSSVTANTLWCSWSLTRSRISRRIWYQGNISSRFFEKFRECSTISQNNLKKCFLVTVWVMNKYMCETWQLPGSKGLTSFLVFIFCSRYLRKIK